MSDGWYEISNAEDVASPALLVYADRVEQNIARMIEMAGGVQRLRPHIKTHKTPELIRLQLEKGITKFKCATIAEAEMAAGAGAEDILLAYQPVGPNVARFLDLCHSFKDVHFSCIVDDVGAIGSLSTAAAEAGQTITTLLDIDVGQHRTGIVPGAQAIELYRRIAASPSLEPGGLHAYDGHIHETDVEQRAAVCEAAFAPVQVLRRTLEGQGLPVPRVIAGGTPTFPMHAGRPDVECSPGTCVFWDAGYGRKLPDLSFLPAATLLTRVVSKPSPVRLCLDLGHKAVAAEMPHPRALFLQLKEVTPVVHSEEHLVIETPQAEAFSVGAFLYAIPWHICPTVALHGELVVVRNARAEERWRVAARDRVLTI